MSDRIDVTARIRARDESSNAIEGVLRRLEGLSRAASAVGQGFARSFGSRGRLGGIGASLQNLNVALGGLARTAGAVVAPLAGLAGVAGGFALTQQIGAYVTASESLRQMAAVLGVSARELHAWREVAALSSVDASKLDSAFQRLNLGARAAATGGNKELLALFQRLGISLDGVRAGTQTGIDLLPQLADAFAKQGNAGTIAAMSAALFGRNMDDVAQMLRMGRGELDAMLAAQRASSTVTDDSVRAAQAFRDAQEAVGRSLVAIRDEIGVAVMPALRDLVDGFRAWIDAARPELVARVTSALRDLIAGVRAFDWAGLAAGMETVGRAFLAAVDFVGGFRNVLIGVAAISLAPLATGLLGVVGAVVQLGVVLAANPIGAAIIGIALAAVAIYRNWDAVAGFFARLWGAVKDLFGDAVDVITAVLGAFGPAGLIAAWAGLTDFFVGMWGGVVDVFATAIGRLSGMIDTVRGWVSWLTGTALDTVAQAFDPRVLAAPMVFGGGAAAAPASPGWTPAMGDAMRRAGLGSAGSGVLVQQAARTEVQGEVRVGVDIRGAPPGTTAQARSSGIAAAPDVGISMAPVTP